MLEGTWEVFFPNPEESIPSRLAQLADRVPPEVETGFHLCYGDSGHRHFKQPGDAAVMVRVTNGIFNRVGRSINWVHMSVPRDRTDDAYFAPIGELNLPEQTELYLGLVHVTDGVEGTQRRIEAARRVIPQFGVTTECGLGRRPPETIPQLLGIHPQVARPL